MARNDPRALYDRTRDELLAKQLSNSESYDRSVLSLSTAFLGLSVAFVSDVFPLESAKARGLLFASWLSFAAAVILTIFSFIYGQRGIKRLLAAARAYYLEGDDTAYSVSSRVAIGIDRTNLASGSFFILGILCTIAFALVNAGGTMKTPREEIKSQPTNAFEVRPSPSPATHQPAPQTQPEKPPASPESPPD